MRFRRYHGLMAAAIADGRMLLANPRYVPNSTVYHAPRGVTEDGYECEVCAAGAVIAMSLGAEPCEDRVPSHWPRAVERRLETLDALRWGDLIHAAQALRESAEWPTPEDPAALEAEFKALCPNRVFYGRAAFAEFLDGWETARDWLKERGL